MIELTVKTLDSQNHQFSVEDDITVEQFKAHIADTVNIPADTQRIIYCGRVLQDNSKLADYDVNGKVVHLVQRPPPSSTPRPTSRSSSPQPQRRGFRGFRGLEQGNAMYLGSMAFPGNLMESQGIVPPPPTHSLSGSRLNVAKRMLRRAEAVIRLLENPSARPQESTPPEENQEEEVTPVIEARVLVPASNSEPIDEAMVLNAVQTSLMNATSAAAPLAESAPVASGSGTQSNAESAQRSPNQSESSTPEGATPRSASTENLASESRSENNNGLPENASRTSEMAELLTILGQLQTRFAPFLERYQNFMQEDPEVTIENQRQMQTMLNRVSEVLHFLGHAYHSLSDIIIRVRTPPPRPLLCRPILIQHSAVVQTGIPIQVEAQINLSADRAPAPAGAAAAAPNQQPPASGASDSAAPTAPAAPNGGGPSISVQPGFVGLPFLPGAAMRVQSFPVEIRTMRAAAAAARAHHNNNNNSVPAPDAAPAAPAAPGGGSAAADAPASSGAQEGGGGGATGGQAQFNFGNPNVEFIMEVTPEVLRGAMNGPPPEFLQSLMQMAGQIISRNIATTAAGPAPPPSSDAAASSQPGSTQAAQPAGAAPGQNSQARGNTQTNPTTATYTRSTPRPHVHLAQQAMQGGFDPFLPCNSHHISRRRLFQAAQAQPAAAMRPARQEGAQPPPQQQQQPTANAASAAAAGQSQNVANFINGIFEAIRSEYRRTNEAQPGQTGAAPPAAASGTGGASAPPNLPPFAALFSSLQGGGNLPDLLRQGPTLDQLLQQFHQDEQYVQGESLITDLIMLFVRNLTLVDLFTLNSGNVEPINRNRAEIQNFFRMRVCNGNTSPAGIDRGVDLLITEMQPFLENFRVLPVQDDIDMVRSAEQLFRQRLPNIVNIAINLNANSVRLLLDQCVTTVQQLCALTLMASAAGQQGVEQVFEQIMNRFMQDIPQGVQNWTLMTSRVHLRQVMSNLSVPESILQPYIVRRSEASLPSVVNRTVVGDGLTNHNANTAQPVEAMELDEQDTIATESDLGTATATIVLEDTEPLPNIVLGSEPWHGQVPEDWVPIIARDAQKQRRQNPQGPFSDAYLSGMPSKRRKIVNSTKPQGSLPQVITESVRQAVTATGLSTAAPLEAVAQAAGASAEIQSAYRSLLRTSVQASLRDNEDFTPERFPNAASYFNGSQ